jgi:hypothetical protein
MESKDDQPREEHPPLLSVVRGQPDEEDLAALTLALLSRRGGSDQTGRPIGEAGRLLARRQRIGAGLRPGPGSWRRARPR